MYQYRITVNGVTGAVTAAYPGEQWARVAQAIEDRGGCAVFERRLVTDADILPLLTDSAGCVRLGERVALPWDVIAAMEVA